MKIRFFGFTFKAVSKNLTLDLWASHLHQNPPDIGAVAQGQRLLLLNDTSNANYRIGLVVTVKDQRRFCQLVNDAGGVTVRVNELGQDTGLMDFNFFVVHKLTGAGLYQHYHQSCSVTSFCELARKRFADFKAQKIDASFSALSAVDQTPKKREKIESQNSGRLQWTQLVRQEALEALIAELDKVKAFEYQFTTPVVTENEFRPLANHIQSKSTRISFITGTPTQLAASAISNFVRTGEAKRGRVEGVDSDGNPQYLSIINNPDNFGEYEFDDVADQLHELNLSLFHESWVVQELLLKCHENRHIIEVPTAP